jgi:hypothetical protein
MKLTLLISLALAGYSFAHEGHSHEHGEEPAVEDVSEKKEAVKEEIHHFSVCLRSSNISKIHSPLSS